MAAFCPAASPSKVKITFEGARSASSRMIRRSTLMWSRPNAVPQVAMAVSTPERWQAMTSVYPSTTTAVRSRAIAFFAASNP